MLTVRPCAKAETTKPAAASSERAGTVKARDIEKLLVISIGDRYQGSVSGGHQLSVGSPAAFHARIPPARWQSYGRPDACAACDAVTERRPERQANTTCLPCGSGICAGSKHDNGTMAAPG